MAWALRILLILLLAAAAWLWWLLDGSVPSKDTIEGRLLGLDKNAPFRAVGLQRRELEVAAGKADGTADGTGNAATGELTYVHVPRRAGVADPLPADAPPIVLVHPTPHTLFTWSEVLFGPGGLAGRCDVYALEIVGHGVTRTPWPKGGGFQTGADWIAAALRALGLRDVCLVGQSYGGEFAWRCALDHPDLVGRLVLIDSSGYPRADGDWLPEEVVMRQNALASIGYALNARERVRGALQVHFRAPVPADRVEEVFQVCESADSWRAMIDLVRDENGTRHAELIGLRQPTLVIWGQQDHAYAVERYGRRFAADIPDARLVTIAECGHYPQEERPAEVAAAIAAFLGAP
ncbi:MAG: alpha/beta hydrolase [Planctomycetes bacterium]|nr:alpha/beta hydrolase [Planctomycetota bacterium]